MAVCRDPQLLGPFPPLRPLSRHRRDARLASQMGEDRHFGQTYSGAREKNIDLRSEPASQLGGAAGLTVGAATAWVTTPSWSVGGGRAGALGGTTRQPRSGLGECFATNAIASSPTTRTTPLATADASGGANTGEWFAPKGAVGPSSKRSERRPLSGTSSHHGRRRCSPAAPRITGAISGGAVAR